MSSSDPGSDFRRRALLPAGLRDMLPPNAGHEAATVEALISCCESYGYGRVKPPLVEFEDSLFAGPGAAMTERAFRLMDPVSQRMMGIRADVTVQIARIAATRLGHLPRPLRLCYSGQVLRVTPDELNPERELVQVGAELVGSDTVAADVEIILLAIDALRRVGVETMSVDITACRLVPELLAAFGIAESVELRKAIDHKDPVGVEEAAGEAAGPLTALMAAADTWDNGLTKLRQLRLPAPVRLIIDRLEAVVMQVIASESAIEMTIDPVESRGFEYYSGLGFSLFSRGNRGELGRGGRYMVNGVGGEGSCGFTLYMECVLRAIPNATAAPRLYIPFETSRAAAASQRAEGWITVAGLASVRDMAADARRLGCTHRLLEGRIVDCSVPESSS